MIKNIDYSAINDLLKHHHLPANIVVRIIQLLMSDDTDFKKISIELEQNAVLAAKVFNVINSGYYYLPHKITDINHAISLLGLEKLREILLCVLFYEHTKSFSKVSEEEKKRFFLFSFVSALLTQRLAQIKGIPIHGLLYSQMLLRHIGYLFFCELESEATTQLLKNDNETLQTFLDAQVKKIGFTHIALSKYILEKWHLPQSFVDEACCYVHCPDDASHRKIMTFCEEFVWAVLHNHIIEELPYFFIFTEKELLMSLSLLDEVIEGVLPKIKNFMDAYQLDTAYYQDFENIHKFFAAEKHEFSRDVIVTLNKRLYKQEFLHEFLKDLVYGDPSKAFASFFTTFTTYFHFDRVFFFDKNSHGYHLREYLADFKPDIFSQQIITMPDTFGDKIFYTESEALLHPSFIKRIGCTSYYIFPIPGPGTISGFILGDNALTQRKLTTLELDEIVDFLSYTGMIYLRLCADESVIVKEKLHLVHDLSVTLNHRINSPLTAILATVELLLRKIPAEKALLERITAAVNDVSSVMKEFEDSEQVRQTSYVAKKTMLDTQQNKGEGDAKKT